MSTRIALITFEFPPDTGFGGIATYTKELASMLSKLGKKVHVFAASGERNNDEHRDDYWIHWVKSGNPGEFRIKVLNRFSPVHQEIDFNIIESPEIFSAAEQIHLQYPKIPLVVRLHGPNYLVETLKKTYSPWYFNLRIRLGAIRRFKFGKIYRKIDDPDFIYADGADYLTAPSSVMKDWAIKNWGIDPERITVIPNPLTLADSLLSIPIPQENYLKTIIFFGRLNALKGLVSLTKAAVVILKKYPDWKLLIIGEDGPGPKLHFSMKNWIKLKLKRYHGRIEFIDAIPNCKLHEYLSRGEIVVLPSLFESYSYCCVEAMAAGRALIGSTTTGMIDYVLNNKTGILVDPYNWCELASKIEFLILNDKTRFCIAAGARAFIENQIRERAIMRQFEAYFDSVEACS